MACRERDTIIRWPQHMRASRRSARWSTPRGVRRSARRNSRYAESAYSGMAWPGAASMMVALCPGGAEGVAKVLLLIRIACQHRRDQRSSRASCKTSGSQRGALTRPWSTCGAERGQPDPRAPHQRRAPEERPPRKLARARSEDRLMTATRGFDYHRTRTKGLSA